MAEKPWIKWFTSDFLNGVGAANMGPEEIGVYAVLLSLMADRGAPIEDDRAWIARKAGTSTRKAGMIIDKLISIGKIKKRAGMLGNDRMVKEIRQRDGKSEQARTAAITRWRTDEQPEFDLGEGDQKSGTPDLSPDYPREKPKIIPEKKSEIKSQKPQKTANGDDADAYSPSRARVNQTSEARIIRANDSPSVPATPDADPQLPHRDLKALLDACSAASGYFPVQPGQIAKAMDMVKAWRDAGIDFDAVVIPVIRNVTAGSSDPTSSLARFDRKVRHEHARKAATPAVNGRAAYRPPESPILHVEGEPPQADAIRKALLSRLGPEAYCRFVNPVTFEAMDMGEGSSRKPLRVNETMVGQLRLLDGDRPNLVSALAKQHGFNEVW